MSNEHKDLQETAPPPATPQPQNGEGGSKDHKASQSRDVETAPLSSSARAEEFPSGPVAPPEDVPQPAETHDAEELEDAAEDDSEDEIAAPTAQPAEQGQGQPQPGQPQQAQAQPGAERPGRRRRRRRGRGGRGGGGEGQQQQGQQQGQPQAQPDQPQQQRASRDHKTQEHAQPQRHERHERREKERHDGRQEQQRHGGRDRHERGHGRGDRHEREEQRKERERGEHVHHRAERPKKPIKREVLANTSFEETRIAIVEDGRLAELLWERKSEESIVGNIYKGQVENVLPGISSAFVNIGFEKNAYLYISDVLGERGAAIDATLKKGQQIMIQVAKEAIGTKGMKVTMDVSLPGRYLVFTPFQSYVGISKHIEEPGERKRLGAVVDRLVAEVLGGKGVVVRTEAEGASEEDLEREVRYLKQTWDSIQKKFESQPAPALLHKDLDLTLQVARDILSEHVYVYLIDNKQAYQRVVEFVEGISPELKERVRYYDAKTPIFKAFELEQDIQDIRKTKVPLPNGGSIVIQEAESLCAIDVNTGRFTGSKSQEETVTATNIEAANEVAHQLRLRNIGGIIVVDFIDMRKASNRNKVMEAFALACKNDRAKIRILPITRLGLIELTRERKRESTVSLITDECPECKGAGRVLSAETIRIRIQREICDMTGGRPGGQVRLLLHPKLAEAFRQQQASIEKNVQRSVKVQGDPQIPWEDYRIVLE